MRRLVPLALLLAAGAAAQDDPVFRSLHLDLGSGVGLNVASGDLDGDGRADLVVSTFKGLQPLAGRGDGSFVLDTGLALPGGGVFQDIAVADVDGDGVPDLLTSGGPAIDLDTGHGDLTFTPHPDAIDAIADTAQLLVLDLDGDGDADIAAGNHQGVRVTVHLNAGQGVFAPHAEYGAIPQGFVAAAGDWDLDGDPDLVFGEFEGDGLELLFNHGDGSFGSPVPIIIPSEIGSVAAGDLDGDGDPDIVATANFQVRVLAGDGHGGFSNAASLPKGGGGDCIAVADMDEDGHADILMSDFVLFEIQVALYSGLGNLQFAAPTEVSVGMATSEFVLGDFDRDGRTDIAGVDLANDGVTVALGRGGEAFFPDVAAAGQPQSVALADFDHDGRLDLVSANAPAGSQTGSSVDVARGLPQGAFAPPLHLTMTATPVGPAGVWAGPLTDDGDPDLVFASAGFFGGFVRVLPGNGALGFGAPTATSCGNDLRGLDAADFDGDGHMDVVTSSNALDQDFVLFGHGDGSFAPPLVIDAWLSPNGPITGDWNGDGRPDFAVGHSVSENALQILLKAPGAGFLPAQPVITSLFIDALASGDVDLDGDLDLVATGVVAAGGGSLFLGDGAGGFTETVQLGFLGGTSGVAVGDLDNDGLPDVLASRDPDTHNLGGVAFLAGHGDGSFEPAQDFDLSGPAKGLVLGDLDLDGVPDAVVALGDAQAVASLLSRRGPWDDLQHPLAGANGFANQTGEGTLQGGAPFAFRLADAKPFAAAFHVVGLSEIDAPFKGGVLVPSPNLLNGPLPISAQGTLELAGPWISGLPSGLQLYFQFWWADAGGPKGFAASRALRATMP